MYFQSATNWLRPSRGRWFCISTFCGNSEWNDGLDLTKMTKLQRLGKIPKRGRKFAMATVVDTSIRWRARGARAFGRGRGNHRSMARMISDEEDSKANLSDRGFGWHRGFCFPVGRVCQSLLDSRKECLVERVKRIRVTFPYFDLGLAMAR